MLAVPLKKTKETSWTPPLRAYMGAHFNSAIMDEHSSSLQKLDNARSHATNITTPSAGAIKALEKYVVMLTSTQVRFPIGGDGHNPQDWKGLNFDWFDSFKVRVVWIPHYSSLL